MLKNNTIHEKTASPVHENINNATTSSRTESSLRESNLTTSREIICCPGVDEINADEDDDDDDSDDDGDDEGKRPISDLNDNKMGLRGSRWEVIGIKSTVVLFFRT